MTKLSLKQVAESYIPDPSAVDPSGRIVDSKEEIAEHLLRVMPYDVTDNDGEYTIKLVFDAICEHIEDIRTARCA